MDQVLHLKVLSGAEFHLALRTANFNRLRICAVSPEQPMY